MKFYTVGVSRMQANRKHQQRDYTYTVVLIVYAATKLTTFMHCNYNS